MQTFTKGNLKGTLQPVLIDHCRVGKNGKIVWTNKTVLMLLDMNGRMLSSAQFRTNAKLKAEKFLVSLGWLVTNENI